MRKARAAVIAGALLLASPVFAQRPDDLAAQIGATLAQAGPGTRFGLLVIDDAGREIVAIDPDGRYIPASNTKMFTTAAAYAMLTIDTPDAAGGASVRIDGRDVVLTGHGDARLSSAADCAVDCLATLADVVAARMRRVRDVSGDDSAFPDERWSPGMSWNNIATRSGTGISALTLDDNELALTVTAGATSGASATIAALPYYIIDNRIRTVASGRTDITFDRMPDSRSLRLEGTIAIGAAPETLRVGVDDPADYAAWRFAAMLRDRGVRVTGTTSARHRPHTLADDPATRGATPVPRPPEPPVLAVLVPPPLAEDLTHTNKVSQNLHAELLLRRVGAVSGSGSIRDGIAAVRTMLDRAGVARHGYDFSDGSGMSSYNRVAPRASVTFLRWITTQPWGAAWRATLPVGGVDGTLARRFQGTALEGKIFAKTGSLNATNALAGYLTASSGRTLTFAVYANDVPDDVAATKVMDAALLEIAAAN